MRLLARKKPTSGTLIRDDPRSILWKDSRRNLELREQGSALIARVA